MKNSKALYHELISRISVKEDDGEIVEIVHRVMEKVYGLSRTEILTSKEISTTPAEQAAIDLMITRINAYEPIQYILNEADFYGRKFFVDKSVLIPRPETEELVRLVIEEFKTSDTGKTIVDIGTGSGCIAVTLSLELPDATIYATDVSDSALATAGKNASALSARVNFTQHNVLSGHLPFDSLHAIVSNPPYVSIEEKSTMKSSVFAYDPNIALFVPDEDPLFFYKAIVETSYRALVPAGMLVVEINERFGNEVATSFELGGYTSVTVIKDMFRKERFVKGYKKS